MAYKCLKAQDGIIVLVDLAEYDITTICDKDVSINLADYGLLIRIGSIEIPIPELLIDFILENRNIIIYNSGVENYVEGPSLWIELARESLIEAKGIYNFWKGDKEQLED